MINSLSEAIFELVSDLMCEQVQFIDAWDQIDKTTFETCSTPWPA